jgi:hypothetical protein
MKEWKEAKVHPDCEIQVDKNFYSVPHPFIGKYVRVRLGARTVEIFDHKLKKLATHVRQTGCGRHSRYDWHYPSEQLQLARYEIRNAKEDAAKVGPRTVEVIEKLFEGNWPLRGLRRAQGVLRISKLYSREALEYACSVALQYGKLRVDYIKACAQSFSSNKPPSQTGNSLRPQRESSTLFLHSTQERILQ